MSRTIADRRGLSKGAGLQNAWGVTAWAAVLALAALPAATGQEPDEKLAANVRYGMALTPIDREQVYEFAAPPAVRNLGRDRYEISFASKAACDATVVIEDATGRIVRHLASGVLGSNAPDPFQKNSLAQTLIWNGKNDGEQYVRNPDLHQVRVSLGLKPTLDKIIGWHPKDTTNRGCIASLGADPDGVYVLETSNRNRIKMFDHDGNYKRMVAPAPADTLGRPEQKIALRTLENGRSVPVMIGEMGITPYQCLGGDATYCQMAVGNGWIVLPSIGVWPPGGIYGGELGTKRLIRLRTDGTTGGLEPIGKTLGWGYGQFRGQCELCFSPDGKWIYVSGLPSGDYHRSPNSDCFRNCVMRFAFDDTTALAPRDDSFVGEIGRGRGKTGADSDRTHLNGAAGVATDAAGNLYVCDYGNNRIQVFTPLGKFLATVPCQNPREIAVSPKTGEIFVLSFRCDPAASLPEASADSIRIAKFKGLADPTVCWTKQFPEPSAPNRPGRIAYWPIFTVDFWSDPVRVWMVRSRGRIQIYNDTAGGLELYDDFIEDVAQTGLRPQMIGYYKMNRVVADPTRNLLYMSRTWDWVRVDPDEGKKWQRVNLMAGWVSIEDIDFGPDGLVYVRPLRFLARFDPDKMVRVSRAGGEDYDLSVHPGAEVPFDYGERLDPDVLGGGNRLQGVIPIPAQAGACGFDTGMDVSPNGKIVAMVKNIQSEEARGYYGQRGPGCYIPPLEVDRFRPRVYPGRPWYYEELVWVWDSKGQVLSDDLVAGLPNNSEGVRMDLAGNVYVGVGYHQNVNGKAHFGGAVAKFLTPAGGKFLCEDGKPAGLNPLPSAPPDYMAEGFQSRVWAVGMQWSYPGLDQVCFKLGPPIPHYTCLCANCRFDTDPFGRCFIPKAYQYTVGVVDASGNRICEIGRYGNADSGRGPESTAKAEGDSEISLAGCSYVGTLADRWLYIMDDGNARVIRVKLGYHVERRLPVPQTEGPR